MKRAPTREKAQAIFERKLLDAEKQGTRCNLRGTTVKGGCAHTDKLACWAELYGLLFKALKYGRRRGLISIIDPWTDRSWLTREQPKP